MSEMTPEEKFLFDVQGFIVVEGFLSLEEITRLNEAIDANHDRVAVDRNQTIGGSSTLAGATKREVLRGMLTWPEPWNQPFRDLLAHPKLVPYLNTLLGPGWKIDHHPVIFMAQPGSEGLIFHGSGRFRVDPSTNYLVQNGVIRTGLLSLEFHLVDHEEGEGGFSCIPGSHKAEFPPTQDILEYEKKRHMFVNPPARAGDLLIFTEAVIHGTLPWRAPHERRSALYRYTPRYMHYAGGYYRTSFPEWVDELTEQQRAVLEPPYVRPTPPSRRSETSST